MRQLVNAFFLSLAKKKIEPVQRLNYPLGINRFVGKNGVIAKRKIGIKKMFLVKPFCFPVKKPAKRLLCRF